MSAEIVHPGAEGWPSSVNTLIFCRLTAAALELKTSSGMNQLKEK